VLEGGKVIEGTGNEYSTFLKLRKTILDLMDDETVLHDNSWLYSPILLKSKNPELKIMHTHHGPVFGWKTPPPYPKPCLLGVSKFNAFMLGAEIDKEVRYVYNGIDLEKYPLNTGERSNRLLFLNRIDPVKGAHIAIYLAKKWGWKLDIVGGERLIPDPNYPLKIMGRCEGEIRYYGEVTEEKKIELLQNAKAVIGTAPDYSEPFGLWAIEAMACGVPVITLNRGALGEVIAHGKTGFLCNSWEEFREYVEMVDEIRPEDCRNHVKEKFSKEVMCENYLKIYKDLLNGMEW